MSHPVTVMMTQANDR